MTTALIVEDDCVQANLVARLVKLRDFQPILASTGETGLEMARELRPDVVLLDVMLPDTDGFEICRRLRSDVDTMSTPIVMLSALDDDRNKGKGIRVGANAYLTKPCNASDLFHALSTAASWKRDLDRERLKGEIHIELKSLTALLEQVDQFLTQLLIHTPLTAEQAHQLRQAVMEIAQNAIEWGNCRRVEELVQITCRFFHDRVEVVVKDQGAGFDHAHIPHAADPDDPIAHLDVRHKLGLREGGFGLLISKGMVDELSYQDPGNQVTLTKRYPKVAVAVDAADPPEDPIEERSIRL